MSVPTRSRGMDTPHILDLVISNDNIIENIECESLLGKSDHSVLLIECKLKDDVQKTATADKYAYSKGNYNDLRNSLNDVSWDRLLNPCKSNIDDMWQIFKSILESKIDLHIPKVKNFNTFKKENWSRPLNSQIRKKIARKHRLWTRYTETCEDKILRSIKLLISVVCHRRTNTPLQLTIDA